MSTRTELNRAYRTALLLTGSNIGAEFAVTQAIEQDPVVMGNAVAAALSWRGPADPVPPSRQPLLQSVFALPRLQRQCYVLRILEGLSAGECARLLGLSAAEVDAIAADAATTQATLASVATGPVPYAVALGMA